MSQKLALPTLPTLPTLPAERPLQHLSYSAISTFQQCPLRFYFKYVEHLPEASVSASLVFGNALHRSVQWHFEQLLAGQPPPDLDTLLAVFWDGWESRQDSQIRFGKDEDLSTMGMAADRLLRVFQDSEFARPRGTILGVEEELRGHIVPDVPQLLARVDLILDEGDDLLVVDFKTSRTAWNPGQVEEHATQLLLYGDLAQSLANEKRLRLAFAVLTKTKVPTLTLHDVPVDPQQFTRNRLLLQRVWKAIEAGHFYPNPSTLNCTSCPYREPCRAWTG